MNNHNQSDELTGNQRLIESDDFPIEFVSELAEIESWRKEVYRPVYHIHKWWANRLGSVFRAILLGSALPESERLADVFYRKHDFNTQPASTQATFSRRSAAVKVQLIINHYATFCA